MGVNVSELGVSAFISLFVVMALIGVVVYMRRRGHLQSRGVVIALAALVGLLIVFGMGAGLVPSS
jgi:hypothetical protein